MTPLFTKLTDVLPQDLVKSLSRKIRILIFPVALKFYWHFGSSADENPVNMRCDTGILIQSAFAFSIPKGKDVKVNLLSHWKILLKMTVKGHTYIRLEVLVQAIFLLDWESIRPFYQDAVSTKQYHLAVRMVPKDLCVLARCFVLCMINSAIFLLTNLFYVHRQSWT